MISPKESFFSARFPCKTDDSPVNEGKKSYEGYVVKGSESENAFEGRSTGSDRAGSGGWAGVAYAADSTAHLYGYGG